MNPYGMFHSKCPERDIVRTSVCPMEQDMNHEGTCHIHDGLDSTLSTRILVLSADARERLTLLFLVAVLPKLFGREDSIITMIVFDFADALVKSHCLKHDLPITILLAPRETWFPTQMRPEAASLKMVPPWEQQSGDRPFRASYR